MMSSCKVATGSHIGELSWVCTDDYSCSIARPQMLPVTTFIARAKPSALCDPFYHHCLKHQLQIHWLEGVCLSAFICTSCYQLVLAYDKQYTNSN